MSHERIPVAVPAKVSAVLLALTLLPSWSYGYYQLLRIIVCASAAYVAWDANREKRERLMWIMVVLAILYNPVSPIYLDSSVRLLINMAAAAVFWVAATNPKRIG